MTHKILIWSKNKKTGVGFLIEKHVELSQGEIENLAMKQYSEDYDLNENREYWAELEETTI